MTKIPFRLLISSFSLFTFPLFAFHFSLFSLIASKWLVFSTWTRFTFGISIKNNKKNTTFSPPTRVLVFQQPRIYTKTKWDTLCPWHPHLHTSPIRFAYYLFPFSPVLYRILPHFTRPPFLPDPRSCCALSVLHPCTPFPSFGRSAPYLYFSSPSFHFPSFPCSRLSPSFPLYPDCAFKGKS